MNNKNIFKTYTIVFIISCITYILVLFDIQSIFKEIKIKHLCILNDSIFSTNVLIYLFFIFISIKSNDNDLDNSEKKPEFWISSIIIGFIMLIVRWFLNKFCSNAFSNIFGYSNVSFKSNKLFYDIINDTSSNNSISKIYSNYGSLLNFIDYQSVGYSINNTNVPTTKKSVLNKIMGLFFDSYNSINKRYKVENYFNNINIKPTNNQVNNIVDLLETKYNIAKYIWSLLLIVFLYSLSVRFVYL